MICVFLLYDGSTRRLTESGFMCFLRFYGEAGNRTCDPWFTRHSAYPLHHRGFWNLCSCKLTLENSVGTEYYIIWDSQQYIY